MVRVDGAAELRRGSAPHRREAEAAFGDGRLYVERFVGNARHVEVQVLGDHHGSVVHLGDRDCTLQRRYQKLVEEAPAAALSADAPPAPSPTPPSRIGRRARLSRRRDRRVPRSTSTAASSRFLEINTRVQVEHPVTEMVTGVDIVREQLRIAAGEPLSFGQDDVRDPRPRRSSAASTPSRSPTASCRHPGRSPAGIPRAPTDVRVDSHCFVGYDDHAVLRLAARQAHRARRRSGRGDRPGAERARRLRDRGRRDDPRARIGGACRTADFRNDTIHTRWLETTLLPELSPTRSDQTARNRTVAEIEHHRPDPPRRPAEPVGDADEGRPSRRYRRRHRAGGLSSRRPHRKLDLRDA